MFGERVTRGLTLGRHRLRISNTLFWKTLDFDVRPKEQVRFEIINRAGRLTYPLLGLIGAAPLYMTVHRIGLGLSTTALAKMPLVSRHCLFL